MAGRDTRTRWQGVFARHRQGCAVEQLSRKPALGDVTRVCTCTPSYYAKVYDRARGRTSQPSAVPTVAAARSARKTLLDVLEKGELPREAPQRLRDAHARFIAAAEEGRALNKHGRRYKQLGLGGHRRVSAKARVPKLGARRLTDIRRSDIQRLVDDLTPSLSGSRVRSVVNAIRSLYRWAQERELVAHDPAALVRLPAINATPRDRVATPPEFAALLAALEIEDALPYALAGYAMGRTSTDPAPALARRRPRASERSSGESSRTHASPAPPSGWCRPSNRCSRCSSAHGSARAARRAIGLYVHPGAQTRRACCTPGVSPLEPPRRGSGRNCSQSACTSAGTPQRPGSMPPAYRPRSPPCSWGTRRPTANREPPKSPSRATRT